MKPKPKKRSGGNLRNVDKELEDFMVDMFKAIQKSNVTNPHLVDEKIYRNYKIEFNLFKEDYTCGGYKDIINGKYRPKKTYKAGTVYATGFEYDSTSEFGFKYGKTIGAGKTVEEAFQKAKEYINNEWEEQGKVYDENAVQLTTEPDARYLVRKVLNGEI